MLVEFRQTPEQHWKPPVHAVPVGRQQVPAPPSFTLQLLLQQSGFDEQAPDSARQHRLETQLFVEPQHSVPKSLQTPPGGEHAHWPLVSHSPLQHWLPEVQLAPKPRQHLPSTQLPSQHSTSLAQLWPCTVQHRPKPSASPVQHSFLPVV